MAVAGLAVPRRNVPFVVHKVRSIREDFRAGGEIKWGNTRRMGVPVRKAYVDCLAELVRMRRIHFHIRFAPFNEYDHDGERRRFETASKMFYQLLLHRAVRYYGNQYRLTIHPDEGECTVQLVDYVEALHIEGQQRYNAHPRCIDRIICRDSKRETLLQFLDVTLGALTAHRNGRHLDGRLSEPKRELAIHAFQAFNVGTLALNRDRGKSLSVWNVRPKKRGPAR